MSDEEIKQYYAQLLEQARDVVIRAARRLERDRTRDLSPVALALYRLEYDQLVDLGKALEAQA